MFSRCAPKRVIAIDLHSVHSGCSRLTSIVTPHPICHSRTLSGPVVPSMMLPWVSNFPLLRGQVTLPLNYPEHWQYPVTQPQAEAASHTYVVKAGTAIEITGHRDSIRTLGYYPEK